MGCLYKPPRVRLFSSFHFSPFVSITPIFDLSFWYQVCILGFRFHEFYLSIKHCFRHCCAKCLTNQIIIDNKASRLGYGVAGASPIIVTKTREYTAYFILRTITLTYQMTININTTVPNSIGYVSRISLTNV